jgi:hypothetical protein
VRFSTVVADGAAETAFRQSIVANFGEPPSDSETIVVPVFGRGRAMAALSGSQLDASVVEEVSRFLCGACSCQVKQANPGFDLLLAVNWDERLYGGEPAPVDDAPASSDVAPDYVAIPGGAAPATASQQHASPPAITLEMPGVQWTSFRFRARDWLFVAFVAIFPVVVWCCRRRPM